MCVENQCSLNTIQQIGMNHILRRQKVQQQPFGLYNCEKRSTQALTKHSFSSIKLKLKMKKRPKTREAYWIKFGIPEVFIRTEIGLWTQFNSSMPDSS